MISKGPFSGGMDFERMLLVKVSQIRTLAGEYKLLWNKKEANTQK